MIRVVEGVAEDAKAPSAGAKSLCIPHDQERFGAFPDGENQKCIQCGEKAKRWTMFGRSELPFCPFSMRKFSADPVRLLVTSSLRLVPGRGNETICRT